MNPRTPVVVGVGQVLNRSKDLDDAIEPIQMMLKALYRAEEDSGARLLDQVGSVRVIRGVWDYGNPAGFIAERIASPNPETMGTLFGGNQVQAVLNRSCLDILSGDHDLIVLTGAENGSSSNRARKQGIQLRSTSISGSPDEIVGSQKPEHHEFEVAKGIKQAIQVYPMYENAIRYARGETMDEHLVRVSELWSRFNEAGLENPNAWIQTRHSAEEIRTPSSSNRAVSYPYTKMMNANMVVDMGAALILCSVEKAKQLGIEEGKWVYPYAGVQGYDHFSASVRDNFVESPGVRITGRRVMDLACTTAEELEYVDLYSCFPSAVQVAAKELGLSEDRPLTVTGGLTFGGGPLNNYVMHSVARTVELLRANPGKKGLVTANGGNLYKHVHCIYGSEPPSQDFQFENVQQEIDALPARKCLAHYEGKVEIESYSVMYGGENPTVAHCACLTQEGDRVWANNRDIDVMLAMTQEEFCGRSAIISSDGSVNSFS